jgi:DNA-binding MarR family transcriptional regulator
MNRRDLQKAIFSSLMKLSNSLQAAGDRLSDELTLKQWFLLLLLSSGKFERPSVNELATEMGVTRQSLKKMVSVLDKGGYLLVEKSATDSRALCVSATPKAQDFFQKNKAIGLILLDKAFAGIADEDLTVVLRTLRLAQENMTVSKDNEK